jgi:AICAR transformylase/IMP cyclohydrolase PurH
VASRDSLKDAWEAALACDPVSAYGGVAIVNREVDEIVAAEMDKIFLEIVMAPSITPGALEILSSKKNRIILAAKTPPAKRPHSDRCWEECYGRSVTGPLNSASGHEACHSKATFG